MDLQRQRERLDRRQQAFLQVTENQLRRCLRAFRCVLQAFPSRLAVLIQELRQQQLGIFGLQTFDRHFDDSPLGKAALNEAEVFLEATDHHGSSCLAASTGTPRQKR